MNRAPRLILVDPSEPVCNAWRNHFAMGLVGDPPLVEIRQGLIEEVIEADAIITAGNSFGLMDGGVDLAVAEAFPGIEREVQDAIRNVWRGELPVGAAIRLWTGRCWLIYAPTMRVPHSIVGTDAVYRAMWAALNDNAWALRGRIGDREIGGGILACPGLGTLTGQMDPREAARQMALAWRNYCTPQPHPPTWEWASRRHDEIAAIQALPTR